MDQLNYQLLNLCKRSKEGSYSTQGTRHRILQLSANHLKELGFRKMNLTSLKTKHVEALVNRWKEEEISSGAMKNRMSSLRWWAEKIKKPGIIKKNNKEYGIGERKFVTNKNKGRDLPENKINKISNELVKYSLRLQEQFGLRREESIKFNVVYADKGHYLQLKGSWTKGGKERLVPVMTVGQRQLLNEIKREVGDHSLIPDRKSYVQQLSVYEWQVNQAGFTKMHGLRHSYAQRRYEELTGRMSPAAGGLTRAELTEHQKQLDLEARLIISRELGHEREQITAVYLGR